MRPRLLLYPLSALLVAAVIGCDSNPTAPTAPSRGAASAAPADNTPPPDPSKSKVKNAKPGNQKTDITNQPLTP